MKLLNHKIKFEALSILRLEDRSAEKRYDWKFLAVATFATVFASIIPTLFSTRFYFLDDFQSQYLPAFVEIARMIRAGHLPFVSPHSWGGGNFLGEFQLGVLNPVYLATYVLMESFHLGFELYALVFVALFHWLNAMAILSLGRYLGLPRRLSLAVSLSIQCSAFYLYWNSASWVPGVMSFGFLVLSVRYALESMEKRTFSWKLALSILCLCTGGSAYAIYAFGVFAAVSAFVYRSQSIFTLLQVALVSGMCLPAFAGTIDLLPYSQWNQISQNQPIWRLGIEHLFLLGWPAMGHFYNWGMDLQPTRTIGYIVWMFPLFMSYLFQWSFYQGRSKAERVLIAMAFFCLLQVCLPFPGKLFGSFKFLPYLALFGLMATVPVLYRTRMNPFRDKQRVFWVVGLSLVVLFRLSMTHWQEEWRYVALGALMFYLFYRWDWRTAKGQSLLIASILAFALVQGTMQKVNDDIPDFGVKGKIPNRPFTLNKNDWNLFLYDFNVKQPSLEDPFLVGNGLMFTDQAWINGYSGMWLKESLLNADYMSRISAKLFSTTVVPAFEGKKMVDLLGISNIALHSQTVKYYGEGLGRLKWQPKIFGHLMIYSRPTTPCVFGNDSLCVTYASKGISVDLKNAFVGTTRFGASVSNFESKEGALIIAKPWYPGMRVLLNGKEMVYSLLDGMLPIVNLPKQFQGTVEYNYLSNRFLLFTRLSILFFVVLLMTWLYQTEINRIVRTKLGTSQRSK